MPHGGFVFGGNEAGPARMDDYGRNGVSRRTENWAISTHPGGMDQGPVLRHLKDLWGQLLLLIQQRASGKVWREMRCLGARILAEQIVYLFCKLGRLPFLATTPQVPHRPQTDQHVSPRFTLRKVFIVFIEIISELVVHILPIPKVCGPSCTQCLLLSCS